MNLESLANKLIQTIKQRKKFFKPFTIVIPNKNIEKWFKNYWLNHEGDNVLMLIEFITFNDYFNRILKKLNLQLIDECTYKLLLLKTLKEEKINDIIINAYLDSTKQDYDTKLYDLTNMLYNLFDGYDDDLIIIEGFQKIIYDKVHKYANDLNLCFKRDILNVNCDVSKDNIAIFGFIKHTKFENEFISKLQLKEYKLDIIEHKLTKKICITKAVSKQREIENLHSKICMLLKDEENKYSDFEVVAPNIQEYINEIKMVFTQDNVKFPNIPYNINAKINDISDSYTILHILFNAISVKYFSRLDFSNLIKNKLIQSIYNINSLEANLFINTILKLNAYDNIDLKYVKNRLLLSKFLDYNNSLENYVKLENEEYISYDNISFDDDKKVKIIKLIDNINIFIDTFSNIIEKNECINNDNIDLIKDIIKLMIESDSNKELTKILRLINIIKEVNIDNLSFDIFKYFLLDVIKSKKSNYYSNIGISFRNLDTNYVTSAKYLFFLNCSSKEFPKTYVTSEIDLRKNYIKEKLEEQKDAFYMQCNNCDKLFISYVSKDLKKDDEFEASLLLKDVIGENILEIKLDESRPWNELYTNSSFRKKEYYNNLFNVDNKENTHLNKITSTVLQALPKVVRLSSFYKFLEEPFKYKVDQTFASSNDAYKELENEYMPFEVNDIVNASIISEMSVYIAKLQLDGLSDDEIYQKIEEKFVRKYKLEHTIPQNQEHPELFYYIFANLYQNSKIVVNQLNSNLKKYEIIKLDDTFINDDNIEFKIVCGKEYARNRENNKYSYFQFKQIKNESKDSIFLELYIASLVDIINTKEDKEYEINLYRNGHLRTFNVNKNEAKKIIIKLYNLMNDYSYNFAFPFDNDKKEFQEFMIGLDENWKYFNSADFFDKYSDTGYSENDFSTQLEENEKKIKDLILYL